MPEPPVLPAEAPVDADRRRRRAPLPQPSQPAGSAALAPSQRRAAEARAAEARRQSVEERLRAFGR